MFLYNKKIFYKFFILITAFILLLNNIVYSSDIKDEIVNDYYVYSSKEYIQFFEETIERTVSKAPKLDLNHEEQMALQKARANGLVYVSYPGILRLGSESPNIEEFNIEFLSRVLDIDIEFKTANDFGVEDDYDSVEVLLESGIVDFAGFYNYGSSLENKRLEFISTKPFSKQRLYQISHADKNFTQVDLYTDNVAVSSNVMNVNNLDVLSTNTIVTADLSYGVDLVNQRLVDYFIAEAEAIPYLNSNEIIYSPINDVNLSPDLSMVTVNPEYEVLVEIFNKLYTGAVLEEFFQISSITIFRNRYVIFDNMFEEDDFKSLNYDNEIEVGFYESKGVIEKTDDGLWQGYAVDYLKEISYITKLSFKFVDYTDKSVKNMLACTDDHGNLSAYSLIVSCEGKVKKKKL